VRDDHTRSRYPHWQAPLIDTTSVNKLTRRRTEERGSFIKENGLNFNNYSANFRQCLYQEKVFVSKSSDACENGSSQSFQSGDYRKDASLVMIGYKRRQRANLLSGQRFPVGLRFDHALDRSDPGQFAYFLKRKFISAGQRQKFHCRILMRSILFISTCWRIG